MPKGGRDFSGSSGSSAGSRKSNNRRPDPECDGCFGTGYYTVKKLKDITCSACDGKKKRCDKGRHHDDCDQMLREFRVRDCVCNDCGGRGKVKAWVDVEKDCSCWYNR